MAETQIAFFDYQPAPLIREIRNYRAKKGVDSTGNFRGVKIGTVVEFEGLPVDRWPDRCSV